MDALTEQFIHDHRLEDVRRLALQASKYPDVDMPLALEQIAGWQMARKKLPSWSQKEGILYPPHLSMEQCSSEQTARYKATLAKGKGQTLIDLTGGFGVDFSLMAQEFERAVYVEQQPHLCERAKHNFSLLGLQQAEVVCGDGVGYLHSLPTKEQRKEDGGKVVIYLDPARRDLHGAKTYAISDCTPNILELNEELLTKADTVIIKLSPMLDWHQVVQDIGTDYVKEVHIISVENECKEIAILEERGKATGRRTKFGNERREEREYSCGCNLKDDDLEDGPMVVCVNNDQVFSFRPKNDNSQKGLQTTYESPNTQQTKDISLLSPLSSFLYIYEPNASIMKAGCFAELSERYGVYPIGPNSHLFVSNVLIEDFPGRKFRLEDVSTMNKKALKEHLRGITQANITVRNFPLSVAELRKRLKLTEGGDLYLFATTSREKEHLLLFTKKI